MRTTWLTLAAAAAILAVGCGPAPTDACKGRKAGDVVITELMLDPEGTDTGAEWIELFNALGSPLDLKGMQLYFKRVDGTGLKTHTIRAGTATSRGYFTAGDVRTGPNPAWINYTYAGDLGGLTNTEGVVGIRCGTVVIDEVTWTRTAKAGRSRQFDGDIDPNADTNNDELRWCDAPTDGTPFSGNNIGTPGAANAVCPLEVAAGTCLDNGTARAIVAPLPGDLIITEVMANPSVVPDTEGEWLEVHGVASVDLNGVTLTSGASKNTLSDTQCLRVNAGQDAVLGKNVDPLTNGGLPPVLASFTLSLGNSGETTVGLSAGDAGIDSATVPASLNGIAWQLDPLAFNGLDNDDAGSFCRATVRYGDPDAGDFGTPAAANTACPTMPNPDECLDSSSGLPRAIVRPVPGDIVITEFNANPAAVGDAVGEYVELLVKSAVDLNGLVLGDERAPTGTNTITSPDCIAATPGSYWLFANSDDPQVNGGLPTVTGVITFGLTNSGTPALQVFSQGTLLDRLDYTSSTSGASTQLDPVYTDPADNDVPANLCPTPAGTTYGDTALPDGGVQAGDRGTPGAANVTCI